MNKQLFSTTPVVPVADTRNETGGRAYSMTDEMALLQYAVTGVFNDTFYSTAETQLKNVQAFADKCSTEWIARVAIYARQNGFMKDMPAYLVAYLSNRPEKDIFNFTFDAVIDNIGMTRTFVQMIRSGAVGRKSMGTSPKKAVARLLNKLNGDKVFFQCAGNDPSIADVLRLVHPKPVDAEHDALFGYLLEKDYQFANLPATVRGFEDFKTGRSTEIPRVDFRRLTALTLTDKQWIDVGRTMTWNQLRMNLNTLGRHNCFNDRDFTKYVAERLADAEAVKRQKVLPFAVYNAIQNVDASVPNSVREALGFCLDKSLLNAPELKENTLVLVDSSGSMQSAITGSRPSATSTMNCVTAASYFAASLLKRNPDTVTVIPFDTSVHAINVNSRDSVESITKQLARSGGGTDIACGIRWATAQGAKWKNILIISDNQSWFDGSARGSYYNPGATGTTQEWQNYRAKRKDAKIVCWDIQPIATTQLKNDRSVLNIGGFTESAYDLVGNWFSSNTRDQWRAVVNAIPVR
jgi:60 kDa SS-A/Ro ribonucleoprotein